jgi:hypothetical protein
MLFLVSIESVGMLPPQQILKDAVTILRQKCECLKAKLNQMAEPTEPSA